MGLQAILETIHASGDAQVEEIRQKASAQVSAILAQAQLEARQIEEDARLRESAPAIEQRARILHRARLESLRIVGEASEHLVDTSIALSHERFAAIRDDPSYPAVLSKLTREVLTELALGGTEKPQLLADGRDNECLEKILSELNQELTVRYELCCWGGLMARSDDGRVVVINTLESRLEHAVGFLRGHLAALFAEE